MRGRPNLLITLKIVAFAFLKKNLYEKYDWIREIKNNDRTEIYE